MLEEKWQLSAQASLWRHTTQSFHMPLVPPQLLTLHRSPGVTGDKLCGIMNISVEGLDEVMMEDPETGTYKD